MLIIERVSLLKSTNIFNNVPETVLASLASVTRVVELAADEQFIQDGEMARELYIIVEGCVRVQKNGVKVIDLNAGESVGELAIFDPEPRSADVIALEPTVLLQLDKEPFEEVMADRPEISQGVIQALSRRIREQGRQMAG